MVGGGDQDQVAAAVAALRQYAADGLGQPALDVAVGLAAVAKDPASSTAVNSFAAAAHRLDRRWRPSATPASKQDPAAPAD
jgi:hypothetical protein